MARFIEARECNDYKEFVTEMFCKFIKKGAKTIVAKNIELSTDKIQYAAKFVAYMRVCGLAASMLDSQGGWGKVLGRIIGECKVGIHKTHNRHIILYTSLNQW